MTSGSSRVKIRVRNGDGRPAVPGGRHPALAVAGVPGHVRAQGGGRTAAAVLVNGRGSSTVRGSSIDRRPLVNLSGPSYVLLSRIPVSAQTSGFSLFALVVGLLPRIGTMTPV